jgi:hypothetical protein
LAAPLARTGLTAGTRIRVVLRWPVTELPLLFLLRRLFGLLFRNEAGREQLIAQRSIHDWTRGLQKTGYVFYIGENRLRRFSRNRCRRHIWRRPKSVVFGR